MILAIDTTHEFGSLALAQGGELIEEAPLHAPEGFGQVIYGHIARLLEKHHVRPGEIECFAAAAGPGSFTGVRVGLACAKGLAEAAGRPVAAISNLEAVASFGTAPLHAALLDARRGQIYGAVYSASGGLVSPEIVAALGDWLRTLPAGEIEFLSPTIERFRMALYGTPFAHSKTTPVPHALAAALARIAQSRLDAGRVQDPAAVDANYVRRSDAELFWKE
ncbi:MAG: tRNA (adenosine(37)-N6)-threonylcarbamoyltransferase complex dimerization subunit type 1 TsaB [Bryobacteraceae bacterium]